MRHLIIIVFLVVGCRAKPESLGKFEGAKKNPFKQESLGETRYLYISHAIPQEQKGYLSVVDLKATNLMDGKKEKIENLTGDNRLIKFQDQIGVLFRMQYNTLTLLDINGKLIPSKQFGFPKDYNPQDCVDYNQKIYCVGYGSDLMYKIDVDFSSNVLDFSPYKNSQDNDGASELQDLEVINNKIYVLASNLDPNWHPHDFSSTYILDPSSETITNSKVEISNGLKILTPSDGIVIVGRGDYFSLNNFSKAFLQMMGGNFTIDFSDIHMNFIEVSEWKGQLLGTAYNNKTNQSCFVFNKKIIECEDGFSLGGLTVAGDIVAYGLNKPNSYELILRDLKNLNQKVSLPFDAPIESLVSF